MQGRGRILYELLKRHREQQLGYRRSVEWSPRLQIRVTPIGRGQPTDTWTDHVVAHCISDNNNLQINRVEEYDRDCGMFVNSPLTDLSGSLNAIAGIAPSDQGNCC